MPLSTSDASSTVEQPTRLQQQIVRYRWVGFALIGLTFLLVFNGEWRIGSDSALYRELGRNLAAGEGYTFRGQPHNHAFPGLPMVLAGLERVFGDTPAAFLMLNVAIAIATLFLIYRILIFELPPWIAVTGVLIVGLNAYFQSLTAQILTDLPFLFATCLALYGHQQFRAAGHWTKMLVPMGMFIVGLIMAALLRPSIYILIAALGVAWLWRCAAAPNRRDFIAIGGIGIGVAGWWLLDLRGGEGGALGHDEQRTLGRLANPLELVDHAMQNLLYLVRENLTDILFSIDFGFKIINVFVAGLIIAGGVLLLRRHRLWGVLVMVTVMVTVVVIKTAPRYYVMILPFIAVGWILIWVEIAARFDRRHHDLILGCAVGLVLVTNIGMNVKLIVQQQAKPFFQDESSFAMLEMAEQIRLLTPPDAAVLAPHARELTYLSRRDVWAGEELRKQTRGQSPKWSAGDRIITHAIFPADLYRDQSPVAFSLIENGDLIPKDPPGNDDRPWWIARAQWVGQKPAETMHAATPRPPSNSVTP